ncbi:polyhydroxyalkanoic acid system family protein [Novosphingobium piscinae]|uniref:Polyhydroxyalkanoic acid system family protein n=1 Tax=Novosphingobium piscinae TaxID=1507448 RepID=A0A7X1FZP0_9SPHN|nr:polyhydroxyalkanoic acid system family protein [Novosphingobium piscinae]MBC2669950.1 polyhydroxyalkanoic acid system family protein [Novosphingobium piscinae]
MQITIPHSLGRDEARRRIEQGLPKLAAHIPGGGSLESEWTGPDTLQLTIGAMGQTIPVTLAIEDAAVTGELTIPAFLKMMSGQIAEFVKVSAGKMLDKP